MVRTELLLLTAALVGTPSFAASDPPIRAEVQHAVAVAVPTPKRPTVGLQYSEEQQRMVPVPVPPSDRKLLSFQLTYDLRFTNLSKSPADVPEPDGDAIEKTSFLTMQFQQADGSWESIGLGGLMLLKGDTRFAPCRPLFPGDVEKVKSMVERFTLDAEQFARMGPKPTVRFDFAPTCRQPNGDLSSENVQSEPFVLSMPAQP